MTRKPRDYKAEYKRRLKRAHDRGLTKSQARGHPKKGERSIKARNLEIADVRKVVQADKRKVFGENAPQVVRTTDEQLAIDYEIKLAELMQREGRFEWTSESQFIGAMQAMGLDEREAYNLWFSP